MTYSDALFRARRLAAAMAGAALTLGSGAALAQDSTTPAPDAPQVAKVGANLNISPKRLTFDRAGRSATVYIFNQGTAPAAVDIDLVDRVMLPNGQIAPAEEAAEKIETKPLVDKLQSAKPMLLATPRRAVLEPGKGQTIRIRVMPGAADTAKGEYRTHLTVTTIPPKDLGLTAEQAAGVKPGQLSFTVYSVFGISIPVIVRLGDTDVRAAIANPHLEYVNVTPPGGGEAKRTPVLDFDLVRQGANSLFGNVEVHGAKAKGKDPIGLARGVGVYTEIDRRAMQIPLTRAPAPGESLEISFTDDDTSPGRLLAQSAFTAP